MKRAIAVTSRIFVLVSASFFMGFVGVPALAQSDATLVDFDFNPKSVNVTTGPETVTCLISLTHAGSGVQTAGCAFESPVQHQTTTCIVTFPTSGTIFNGVWTCQVPVQTNFEAGIWKVSEVFAYDIEGNALRLDTNDLAGRGFPTELDVRSSSCHAVPEPENYGYYRKLCKDGHSHPKTHEDVLVDADAACVGALTDTFAGIATVEDLCADRHGSSACVKGEQ